VESKISSGGSGVLREKRGDIVIDPRSIWELRKGGTATGKGTHEAVNATELCNDEFDCRVSDPLWLMRKGGETE